MRKLLGLVLACGLAIAVTSSAFAAPVPFTPSGSAFVSIGTSIFGASVVFNPLTGLYELPRQTFTVAGVGSVQISGSGNPDPSLTSGITATNITAAPLTFSFLFSTVITPTSCPCTATGSVNGGLQDGAVLNGVTLTPKPTSSGILTTFPEDSDGVTETLVSAVSTGTSILGTFTNLGVDVGLTVSGPSGTLYGEFKDTKGFAGAGPWVFLAQQYTFELSAGDTASLAGRTSIEASVPEPGTLLLLGIGLVALTFQGRKQFHQGTTN